MNWVARPGACEGRGSGAATPFASSETCHPVKKLTKLLQALMSRKQITVPVVLALALAMVAMALRGKGRLPQTPEEAVNGFFQAAQRGDAPAFLATLAGPLRSSFEATQSQIGAAALRRQPAGIGGRPEGLRHAARPASLSPTRPSSTSSWSSPTAMSVSGSSCSGRTAVGWLPRSTRPIRSSRRCPTARRHSRRDIDAE